MTDSFRDAKGRKVVSRASAKEIGVIAHLVVDTDRRTVTAVVLGKGKRAELIDWDRVTGFGPDAVMVSAEDALRPPTDDREKLAATGGLELLGKRVLSETGNIIGRIDDVRFDQATGALEMLRVDNRDIATDTLLGSGSYAVVLSARATSE